MTERTRARHGQVALDRGERNGGHRSFPAPLKGAADRRSRDLRDSGLGAMRVGIPDMHAVRRRRTAALRSGRAHGRMGVSL
jgi:hypothetical protein